VASLKGRACPGNANCVRGSHLLRFLCFFAATILLLETMEEGLAAKKHKRRKKKKGLRARARKAISETIDHG